VRPSLARPSVDLFVTLSLFAPRTIIAPPSYHISRILYLHASLVRCRSDLGKKGDQEGIYRPAWSDSMKRCWKPYVASRLDISSWSAAAGRLIYCSPASTSPSHMPSFFSMTSSVLLAKGSNDGPDAEVREAGNERDSCICVEGNLRAGDQSSASNSPRYSSGAQHDHGEILRKVTGRFRCKAGAHNVPRR